jgi:hypothetical protein
VATPRIPVHHAQEPPIGGKLPSYFLKSLTQSFPLEWRDVLRYQRLRKLHTDPHAAHCAPLRDPSGADPARLLARGGRRRGHDVVLRALDDRVELAALALLSAKFAVLGDLREAYVIRRVSNVVVMVNPYSSAASGQVEYTAWERADGNVQNRAAYSLVAANAA